MNTSNIFGFEETEKMGLRKGVVYYFNDCNSVQRDTYKKTK